MNQQPVSSSRWLSVFLLLLIAFGVRAQAQTSTNYILQLGSPSFTVALPIPNGYVNVANGNLHFEIPWASPVERGTLTYPATLFYDSRMWQAIDYGTSSGWDHSVGGFQMNPDGLWRVSSDSTMNSCDGNFWFQYQNYTVTDSMGTQRLFPIYDETSNSCHTAGAQTGSGYALDGSGYFMSADTSSTSPTVNYVLAPDGTSCPSQDSNVQCGPLHDPNGNYFSWDSTGNLVDTLGRTAIAYAGNTDTCPSDSCYSVLAAGGQTVQFAMPTEVEVYLQTAFEQPGVTEYHSYTFMPTSLELPDGAEYQFTWDSGASFTDTTPHYGELTSMTLPTGGTIDIGYTNFTDANGNVNRWVSSVSWGGSTWTFVPATNCGAGCQTVTVTAPDGNQSVYTFIVSNSAAWKSSVAYYLNPA